METKRWRSKTRRKWHRIVEESKSYREIQERTRGRRHNKHFQHLYNFMFVLFFHFLLFNFLCFITYNERDMLVLVTTLGKNT